MVTTFYKNNDIKEIIENNIQEISNPKKIISASSNSLVWKEKIGTIVAFIKRYKYPIPLRYIFRRGRGLAEFQSYNVFSKYNFHHPNVLFFIEKRCFFCPVISILATEEVYNSIDLHQLFILKKIDDVTRQKIIIELAQSLAELHNHRFYHGDFKLRNILYQKNTQYLFWIDCPRGKKKTFFSHSRISDLVTLYKDIQGIWSLEEILLFITIYSQKTFIQKQSLTEKIITRYNKKYRKSKK